MELIIVFLKKAVSVLFVITVMLNAIGYQLFFSAYNLKISRELDNKIDEGKTEGIHTIIFKVPMRVALPYLPSKPIENDLKGELNYKENTYRYVKSTIHNDTIYYECILNKQAKLVKNAFSEYLIKYNNENPSSKKSAGFSQKILKDYLNIVPSKIPSVENFTLKDEKYFVHSFRLRDIYLDYAVPPPRNFS